MEQKYGIRYVSRVDYYCDTCGSILNNTGIIYTVSKQQRLKYVCNGCGATNYLSDKYPMISMNNSYSMSIDKIGDKFLKEPLKVVVEESQFFISAKVMDLPIFFTSLKYKSLTKEFILSQILDKLNQFYFIITNTKKSILIKNDQLIYKELFDYLIIEPPEILEVIDQQSSQLIENKIETKEESLDGNTETS